MKDYAGANEDFKNWRDQGGGHGKFDDFVKDRGDKYPALRDHEQKLKDRKGGSKEKLGTMLAKDKGGKKDFGGKLDKQDVLGGIDGNKKKEKLGGGEGKLLKKDKDKGGFVNQSDKKGNVKLQKKDKTKQVKQKKQRQNDSWKGKKGKGKGKKGKKG